MMLSAGDRAPDFTTHDADGRRVALSELRGHTVVLYFYPMDDTPGCTAQACALRDGMDMLTARGVIVLGVSAQNADAHRRFAAKYRLPFPLLLDPGHRIAKAYGALGHGWRAALRKRFGLYRRITYIIDPQGRIAHVFARPDTRHHAAQIGQLL
jgi:peroxiredoxin Q/BCP